MAKAPKFKIVTG